MEATDREQPERPLGLGVLARQNASDHDGQRAVVRHQHATYYDYVAKLSSDSKPAAVSQHHLGIVKRQNEGKLPPRPAVGQRSLRRRETMSTKVLKPRLAAGRNRTGSPTPAEDERVDQSRPGRAGAKKETLLDDDIETMDALIQVLDAANKRRAEQKKRRELASKDIDRHPAMSDYSVTRATSGKGDGPDHGTGPQQLSRTGLEQPRAESSEQVRAEITKAGAPLDQPEDKRNDIVRIDGKTKKKKFKRKNRDRAAPYNATLSAGDSTARASSAIARGNATSGQVSSDLSSQNKGLGRSEISAKEHEFGEANKRSLAPNARLDHNRVRPGFDRRNSSPPVQDNTVASQNYIGNYQQQHPMVTLDPIGGILLTSPAPADQQHGPHVLFQGHRPIVAHDLLSVHPQRQQQQQSRLSQHSGLDDDERAHMKPSVGIFSPERQRASMEPGGVGPTSSYESQEGGPPTSSHQPLQMIQLLRQHPLLDYGPYQAMQQQQALDDNPYSAYSKSTQRPHEHTSAPSSNGDREADLQFNKMNEWAPVTGPSVHGKPHRGDVQDGAGEAAAPSPQPQTVGSQQQQQQPAGPGGGIYGLNDRYGERLGAGGLENPLQHLLDAAKNQQAAALAYERDRLDYELALRKRQDEMRQQHEANLERQRVAAEQRAAEAAQQQQQQQQQREQQQQQPVSNEQGTQGGGANEQQLQKENGGEEGGGDEQQQQGDNDNDNNNGQEQSNEDAQNNQEREQQQQQDDPDMKNFQNFAGDTDFTDLFPPGILSQAEIDEMRKQQQEQKQRQEQEEQEEREKQQQQGSNADDQGGDNGEEQQQPTSADEDQQQQQQAARSPQDEGANSEQSVQGAQQESDKATRSGKADEKQSLIARLPTGNLTTDGSLQTGLQDGRSQGESNESKNSASMPRVPQQGLATGLPGYLFENVSTPASGIASNQTGALKTRRSRDNAPPPVPLPQPLLVLDSEYQDRYMKPFLNSLVAINRQQLAAASAGKSYEGANSQQASVVQESGSDRARQRQSGTAPANLKQRAERAGYAEQRSDHVIRRPLVDFDDLLENYYDQSIV